MSMRQIGGKRFCFMGAVVLVGIAAIVADTAIATDVLDFDWKRPIILCSGGTSAFDLTIGKQKNLVNGLVFSPDNKILASCGTHFSGAVDDTGSGKIKLWDLETTKLLTVLEPDGIGTADLLVFSPNGNIFVSGSNASNGKGFYDGTIHFWCVSSRKQTEAIRWSNTRVTSLAISNDGRLLAIGGWSQDQKNVRILETSKDRKEILLEGYRINSIAFSPDDRFLFASDSDGTVRIWNVKNWSRVQKIEANGANCIVAVSPNIEHITAAITVGEWSNEIAIWDMPQLRQTHLLKNAKRCINCMTFSPNGRLIALGAKNVFQPPANDTNIGIPFVSCDRTAPLTILDVQKNVIIALLNGHLDEVETVAFSASGTFFASADATGTIRLWQMRTGVDCVGSSTIDVCASPTIIDNQREGKPNPKPE